MLSLDGRCHPNAFAAYRCRTRQFFCASALRCPSSAVRAAQSRPIPPAADCARAAACFIVQRLSTRLCPSAASSIPSMPRCFELTVLCLVAFFQSGCALHYYDKRTGTEHVWGVGHMRMKAAPVTENIDSVVAGTSIVGVALGAGREDYYLSAGWDYRRRIVIGTNAALTLEWPNADFFNVYVSDKPPFLTPGYRYSVRTNE